MQALIQTPTNALTLSLDFYTRLEFTIISKEQPTLVSDGKALIEINPERFARAGMKLIQSSWTTEVEALQAITKVVKVDQGYILSDPSGAWIYLIEAEDYSNPDISEVKSSIIGNYAGLSLECLDIEKSLEIWQALGFKPSMGAVEKGWIALSHANETTVSLMVANSCPHLFFNPSLSYFNGKENLAIIEKIRTAGIPITEEITHFNSEGIVDNVIIRDPGGFGFFIFSD